MRSRRPRRAYLIVLSFLSLGLVVSGGQCGQEPPQWSLVWDDDFTGSVGTPPDSASWRYDVGTDWGNNQLEYDTARPANVSLDGNGHLAITARREDYMGQPYTSGRINTAGKFSQAKGKFEARIRLPIGQGIWPAFWLLGANFEAVGWPGCGEIDIMEYRGQEPSRIHGSAHGPGYSGGSALTQRFDLAAGKRFSDDFHTFGLEWGDEILVWTIDGTPYHTVTPNDLPAGARWVFDHPFFIILNVAVGGNFVGPPNAATQFPQTMLVDWVRVYQAGP